MLTSPILCDPPWPDIRSAIALSFTATHGNVPYLQGIYPNRSQLEKYRCGSHLHAPLFVSISCAVLLIRYLARLLGETCQIMQVGKSSSFIQSGPPGSARFRQFGTCALLSAVFLASLCLVGGSRCRRGQWPVSAALGIPASVQCQAQMPYLTWVVWPLRCISGIGPGGSKNLDDGSRPSVAGLCCMFISALVPPP